MTGSTGSIHFSIDSLAWVAAVLCVATGSIHFSMDSPLRFGIGLALVWPWCQGPSTHGRYFGADPL